MSTQFPNPPTYADPDIKPPGSDVPKFNPIWAKWFIDLVQWINANGGGSGAIQHNSLAGLQGGTTAEYYHLTNARYSTLTGVQNANKVFAGPASGVDAAAAFRLLVAADVPVEDSQVIETVQVFSRRELPVFPLAIYNTDSQSLLAGQIFGG